ncbi:hypothetical protein MBLNU13_g09054t2 [Cladosporium sp. NU13]
MTEEAYSQVLDNWDQWLSPEAGSTPGTTLDPGAPRPFQSPSPYPCASPSVSHIEAEALRLLQPSDWDQEKDYSANPPVCVRYTIIWKVKFNNRMIAKDTEQDIVLAPAQYWSMFLQAKLNTLLSKKIASGKRIKPDDSNVEEAAAELGRVTASASAARGGSATQRMLAERAAQLDAEEASGVSSTWRDVYQLMRCPGPPCSLGPYCWRDPDGKRHYGLKAHYMKSLIRHVEEGGRLETQADVPDMVRQQLYAEQQERAHRKQKTPTGDGSTLPPITINNVLPATAGSGATSLSEALTPRDFDLPGFRDVALNEYSVWHQSKVFDASLKADFEKARDVALENGLDLDLIYEENDPDFFEKQGVKRGTAKRFVRDIRRWAKRHKAQDADTISVRS